MLAESNQLSLTTTRWGSDPMVLTKIVDPEVLTTCWQRQLNVAVKEYAHVLSETRLQFKQVLAPQDAIATLERYLPEHKWRDAFIKDMAILIDMVACLFDCHEVGARLIMLDSAMCPKFHRDNIPCRLVTSYAGPGTQWIDRIDADIHEHTSAQVGDVLLLKGDAWTGKPGSGVLHRSPQISTNQKRLFLSLDPM